VSKGSLSYHNKPKLWFVEDRNEYSFKIHDPGE
jgi:hypothetical protein